MLGFAFSIDLLNRAMASWIIQLFSRCLLDNTTRIRYLNTGYRMMIAA